MTLKIIYPAANKKANGEPEKVRLGELGDASFLPHPATSLHVQQRQERGCSNFRKETVEQLRKALLLPFLSFSPKGQLFSLCFTAWVVLQIRVLPVSTLTHLLWLDPLKKWGESRFLRVFDLKDRQILFELKGFQREDKNWQASSPLGFGK